MLKENIPLLNFGICLHWLAPKGKNPLNKDWSNRPIDTLETLKSSRREGCNIGVRPGVWSKTEYGYLHIIDLDIRKPECAKEAWDSLRSMLPTAKSLPSVISGSGGESRHIYFLTSQPFGTIKLAKSSGFEMVFDEKKDREVKRYDWEIDLCGTGKNVVIPPSIHPVTGAPYIWERHLDLDMPDLMIVSATVIEALGGRVNLADAPDDEDLDYIVTYSPSSDVTEESVLEWLEQLPDWWVDDYDQFLKVGQALHHQFEGSDEGFTIWVEWSEQSSKRMTDREYEKKWQSFKNRTMNPITIGTVKKAATENRKRTDFEYDLSDLLGSDTPLDGEVLPPIAVDQSKPPTIRANALIKALNADWTMLLEEQEHEAKDGTKWTSYKNTLNNFALLIENDPRLFGCIALNEFTQEIVLIDRPKHVEFKRDKASPLPKKTLSGPLWEIVDPINGNIWTDAHDHALRDLMEAPKAQGGHAVKISDRDLQAAVSIVAQKNRFHPIRDRLDDLSEQWNPNTMTPRIDRLFIDYLGVEDTPYHRDTARLMFLAAVTRVYEPGHKYDQLIIIEGGQGRRKSTMIQTLSMGWFSELEGDMQDRKSMVEKMQGAWILEIPELQGFNKADVTTLKGFLSASADKVRLSYGRRAQQFQRQCIFLGSTNEGEYLRDPTGARRFWPVHCEVETIDIDALRREVMWLWAEAAWTYKKMRESQPYGDLPLYLTNKLAAQKALEMQSSRTVESTEAMLSGEIMAWLDSPIPSLDDFEDEAPATFRNETCVSQIWREMLARTGAIPHNEAMKIGAALNQIQWNRSSGPVTSNGPLKKYGKTRIYRRPGTSID